MSSRTEMKTVLQLDLGTQVIDIHKVVAVNADIPTLFAVEVMPKGGNRLTYNAQCLDIKTIEAITFKRQS